MLLISSTSSSRKVWSTGQLGDGEPRVGALKEGGPLQQSRSFPRHRPALLCDLLHSLFGRLIAVVLLLTLEMVACHHLTSFQGFLSWPTSPKGIALSALWGVEWKPRGDCSQLYTSEGFCQMHRARLSKQIKKGVGTASQVTDGKGQFCECKPNS